MIATQIVVGIDEDELTARELKMLEKAAKMPSSGVERFGCGYEEHEFGPDAIHGIAIKHTWNDGLRLDDLITDGMVKDAKVKLAALLGLPPDVPKATERIHFWAIGHQT